MKTTLVNSLFRLDQSKPERKTLKKVYRRELVKGSQLLRIAAAWVITVPVSALLGATAG